MRIIIMNGRQMGIASMNLEPSCLEILYRLTLKWLNYGIIAAKTYKNTTHEAMIASGWDMFFRYCKITSLELKENISRKSACLRGFIFSQWCVKPANLYLISVVDYNSALILKLYLCSVDLYKKCLMKNGNDLDE